MPVDPGVVEYNYGRVLESPPEIPARFWSAAALCRFFPRRLMNARAAGGCRTPRRWRAARPPQIFTPAADFAAHPLIFAGRAADYRGYAYFYMGHPPIAAGWKPAVENGRKTASKRDFT
jgi:hypothetical protein